MSIPHAFSDWLVENSEHGDDADSEMRCSECGVIFESKKLRMVCPDCTRPVDDDESSSQLLTREV